MHETQEIDQFELLEDKVNSLIQLISDLKKEKDYLTEKLQAQETKFNELSNEVEALRANKEEAKIKVISLLEKIEQIEV
jgi:FtsZ-binding cell division protein ZapB